MLGGLSPASTSRPTRLSSRSPWRSAQGLLAISNGPEIGREELDGGRLRCTSATRSRCRPISSPSSSVPSSRPTPSTSTASRCVWSTCRARSASPGPPLRRRPRAALLLGVLRPPLPRREGRPRRTAGLRGGCDGEPRLRHLPRGDPPRRPRRHRARAATPRRGRRARARPHVVRRPRHDALVERHLAERGLRHLHGAVLPGRLPP